ncbi:protein TolQ [Pseudoduganella eburnea]|jgi:biopolymer transport protein TolQ|uniref:Tol-Pal system protein TolQ n=1 Tax=Massilia eburnea TaxID=1776165 RepID=A0A6L6QB75_9BURK|nr:protein TolQ [Massilia eburnea]MTW09329.1 protein TolQ [Massilia eburnea]
MNVTQDLSFISLITNAHVIVQLILVLLLAISIISWSYIFKKLFDVRGARKQTIEFEKTFWAGGNLHALHASAGSNRANSGALARIFEAGMGEFIKGKQAAATSRDMNMGDVLDGARRAMRAAFQREMDALDAHLAFLASVGSVSPYIGLLGTVWGIMNAFRGLANVQQATLSAVAPGIAEALIATAIGLFAAIPAVVAYNRFSHDIERLAIRFESFVEEFSNILQRQSR